MHKNFIYSKRFDVVFDRYFEQSIKSGIRQKQSGKVRGISCIIDNPNTKLPDNWEKFISVNENKISLVKFLCEWLIMSPPSDEYELIVGGVFEDIEKTMSSISGDIHALSCTHEEADTRIAKMLPMLILNDS